MRNLHLDPNLDDIFHVPKIIDGTSALAVKRQHSYSNSYKETFSWSGSAPYHHGGEHGSMQADMVLER